MDHQKYRLVRTLFSKSPRKFSMAVSLGLVILIGVFSQLHWDNVLSGWWINPYQFFGQAHYWQMFTATLIHSDWGHYLSNSYMLLILGFFVFGYFGFWVFPVASLLLAAVTNVLAISTYPKGVYLLGASGLVYVLAGFWLTMFFLIQRQHPIHRRLIRVLGVGLVILFPSTFEPLVSYRTHAIGFAVGLAYALIYFVQYKTQIRSHERWEEISPPTEDPTTSPSS